MTVTTVPNNNPNNNKKKKSARYRNILAKIFNIAAAHVATLPGVCAMGSLRSERIRRFMSPIPTASASLIPVCGGFRFSGGVIKIMQIVCGNGLQTAHVLVNPSP